MQRRGISRRSRPAEQVKGRVLVTGTVRDEAEQKEGASVLRPGLQDVVAPCARRFDATLGEIENEARHEYRGLGVVRSAHTDQYEP